MQNVADSPCLCNECNSRPELKVEDHKMSPGGNGDVTSNHHNGPHSNQAHNNEDERTVDVIIHDAPTNAKNYYSTAVTCSTSPSSHIQPPPPGFIIEPPTTFHHGGNVEELLSDVHSNSIHSTFIKQNFYMCNTKKITRRPCCCHRTNNNNVLETQPEKNYVTQKNIELTYDVPRGIPIEANVKDKSNEDHETTEIASTVVLVERKIPVKNKKFDFLFRSRSAPVCENEEPLYATVNKLPKRLKRMELANLENEVAYKTCEPDSSVKTEVTLKTDSDSQTHPPDDDTSRSEGKSTEPQRAETAKTKKRKRFSLTFKNKRKEKKEFERDQGKNVIPRVVEDDNEKLLAPARHRRCSRHKNSITPSIYGPRYKRDSYQMTSSEVERTASVSSSLDSGTSGTARTPHTARRLSTDGAIPWCGCWGAGCV